MLKKTRKNWQNTILNPSSIIKIKPDIHTPRPFLHRLINEVRGPYSKKQFYALQALCYAPLRKWTYTLQPFHLVDPSPWPIVGSFAALTTTIGAALYMHNYTNGGIILSFGLILILLTMFVWWADVIHEAVYENHYTTKVLKGLKYGIILFITSEVMFFVSFFWAFFHAELSRFVSLSTLWASIGVTVIDPFSIPLLNTAILLTSGATITVVHSLLRFPFGFLTIQFPRDDIKFIVIKYFCFTILLAILFTALQVYEYKESDLFINDGVYGSTFYVATGFHGLHVLIGSVFIIVCLIRYLLKHFDRPASAIGIDAAIWYWHFVDVVWICLFLAVYVWNFWVEPSVN